MKIMPALLTVSLVLVISCGCNQVSQVSHQITVAADGSGQYTSVQAAVDSIKHGNAAPAVIAIGPGTYKERIHVPSDKRFVHFQGQKAETTILTFDLHANILGPDGKPIGTSKTPSVIIDANDFSASEITFANTAGPQGQALAISICGDRAVFKNCRFVGWQDTLYSHTGRHYYKNCYIEGRTDFIFGGGTDYFDRCEIFCIGKSCLTAASTPKDQSWGFVFDTCKITSKNPAADKTYLGRPWRDYAAVTFINTWMDDGIQPKGWHNWNKPEREQTSRYFEYNSTGPGANPKERVSWAHNLTQDQAAEITVKKVLSGQDNWSPDAR